MFLDYSFTLILINMLRTLSQLLSITTYNNSTSTSSGSGVNSNSNHRIFESYKDKSLRKDEVSSLGTDYCLPLIVYL